MIEDMKQWLEALNETVKFFDGVDLNNSFNPPTAKWAHNVRADALWSITSLRQAIEQAEKQEPVEYQIKILGERWTHCAKHIYNPSNSNTRALYTTPQPQQKRKCDNCGEFGACCQQPQREWVGLMDEEIALVCAECAASAHNWNDISFARAIEAKLKEKNS